MSRSELSARPNSTHDGAQLSELDLPRFSAVSNAQERLPQAAAIEALYGVFVEAHLIPVTGKKDLEACAKEAKQMMCEGLGRIVTNMSLNILSQLEAIPPSYSNQDVVNTLRFGGFQIHFGKHSDPWPAFWQGTNNPSGTTLDQVFHEAYNSSDYRLAPRRQEELLSSIKIRLFSGFCDIPGFQPDCFALGSFITLVYKPN